MYPIKTRRTDSPDRIDSLQALRALAFLAVFLVHVDHRSELTCLSIPTFFALSGFLLAFRYREENLPVSPRACFSFARRHIARLYPLHLITMVLSLALLLIGAVIQGFPKGTLSDLMLKAAMNVLLLQSYVSAPPARGQTPAEGGLAAAVPAGSAASDRGVPALYAERQYRKQPVQLVHVLFSAVPPGGFLGGLLPGHVLRRVGKAGKAGLEGNGGGTARRGMDGGRDLVDGTSRRVSPAAGVP